MLHSLWKFSLWTCVPRTHKKFLSQLKNSTGFSEHSSRVTYTCKIKFGKRAEMFAKGCFKLNQQGEWSILFIEIENATLIQTLLEPALQQCAWHRVFRAYRNSTKHPSKINKRLVWYVSIPNKTILGKKALRRRTTTCIFVYFKAEYFILLHL